MRRIELARRFNGYLYLSKVLMGKHHGPNRPEWFETAHLILKYGLPIYRWHWDNVYIEWVGRRPLLKYEYGKRVYEFSLKNEEARMLKDYGGGVYSTVVPKMVNAVHDTVGSSQKAILLLLSLMYFPNHRITHVRVETYMSAMRILEVGSRVAAPVSYLPKPYKPKYGKRYWYTDVPL